MDSSCLPADRDQEQAEPGEHWKHQTVATQAQAPAGRRSAKVERAAPCVEPPQLQDRQGSHVSARAPGDQRKLPLRQT